MSRVLSWLLPKPTVSLRISQEFRQPPLEASDQDSLHLAVFSVKGYLSLNLGGRFFWSGEPFGMSAKFFLLLIVGYIAAFVYVNCGHNPQDLTKLYPSSITLFVLLVATLVVRGAQLFRLVQFSICFASDETIIKSTVGLTSDRVYAFTSGDRDRLIGAVKQWEDAAKHDKGWRIHALEFARSRHGKGRVDGDWTGLRSVQTLRGVTPPKQTMDPNGLDALIRHSLCDLRSPMPLVSIKNRVLEVYRPILLVYLTMVLALVCMGLLGKIQAGIFVGCAIGYAAMFLIYHLRVVKRVFITWCARPWARPYQQFDAAMVLAAPSNHWQDLAVGIPNAQGSVRPIWALSNHSVDVQLPEAFLHIGVALTIEAFLHAVHLLHLP